MKFHPYFIDGELYWRVKDTASSEGIEVEYIDDALNYLNPSKDIGDWLSWDQYL